MIGNVIDTFRHIRTTLHEDFARKFQIETSTSSVSCSKSWCQSCLSRQRNNPAECSRCLQVNNPKMNKCLRRRCFRPFKLHDDSLMLSKNASFGQEKKLSTIRFLIHNLLFGQNVKQDGRLAPAYFSQEYKYFDQHLPTVKNETCLKSSLRKFTITTFRSNFFVSHYRNILLGNTSVYQKILGIEKLYASERGVSCSPS